MKKKYAVILLTILIMIPMLSGCGASNVSPAEQKTQPETQPTETYQTEPFPEDTATDDLLASVLEDGVYSVDFNTDSSMFHVNEACEGKGTLTVADGKMTVHISLVSKSILNLYVGSAEDAKKEGAILLEPTEDTVVYKDGFSETVYGFDVPVEQLDQDFALAIIGKKGTWYDHTVSVTNPQPAE